MATKPPDSAENTLTAKQQRFVDEYLVDLNGTQAAIRTGYSAKTANVIASELLTKPNIVFALDKARKSLQQRTEITQEMVLERWWKIATANPNELIAYRRNCCRHCFGEGHEYQWIDEDEWAHAVRMAEILAGDKPAIVPSNAGGFGFDETIRPHPKCPKCQGEGIGQVFASDTRHVSEQAQALYAGVKITKDGLEIKMQDQGAALTNVARHLGMFNDSLKLKGDEENPLRVMLEQIQGTPLRPKAAD